MVRFGAKKVESFHLFYFTAFLKKASWPHQPLKINFRKKFCDSKNDVIFELP
jgi:hypothetical protein